MAEKLTKTEERLAKRVGKGGRAFVLARRERPGMSLLEYEASTASDDTETPDVTPTAAAPVEAAPVPDSSSSTTAPAKSAAKKTAAGSSAR